MPDLLGQFTHADSFCRTNLTRQTIYVECMSYGPDRLAKNAMTYSDSIVVASGSPLRNDAAYRHFHLLYVQSLI